MRRFIYMVLNHNTMVKSEMINIMKLLMKKRESELTIREISLIRNINYKSAYEAIGKLEKQGSIIVQKKGNSRVCKAAYRLTKTIYAAEKEKLEEIIRKKDMKVIYDELYKLNMQFIAILFGSHAKGQETRNSDIDVLIISDRAEKIEKKISWIPKKIHITSITYNDFIEMLQTRRFNVVSEAIKDNVIFIGLEDYYRFLENANR